ncbi:hypothetical protein Tsubulata_018058, partial [Turnera subulata]
MCQHAVDRSSGVLQRINIDCFGTDELLQYIVDRSALCHEKYHLNRSSNLKSLRLMMCYDTSDEGLIMAAKKMPSLEELELYSCSNAEFICFNWEDFDDIELDGEAMAIAKAMPELRHLMIFGNLLTNDGLKAILDGCPHLESLDLRQCFNLKLEEGGLGRRCAERIKVLLLPNDSTAGYPFVID